jgi:hypothetical protein
MPNWPGFVRSEISSRDLEDAKRCESEAVHFLDGMVSSADEVEIAGDHMVARFNIEKKPKVFGRKLMGKLKTYLGKFRKL